MSAPATFLRRTVDADLSIRRVKAGRGFRYIGGNDKAIKDKATLSRIASLGLPPAYRDVLICADEHGHLQATGYDARGRKQYRYHPEWTALRARQKYDDLTGFAAALPALRSRVDRHLRGGAMDKNYACAAMARLLDRTAMRLGDEAYSRENGSFGATTLKTKHVKFKDGRIAFDYRAKGGKRVRRALSDKRLHRILERIDDLKGERLFQYIGDDGQIYALQNHHVNDYLGDNFSAKTFRTWRGTVAAFARAMESEDKLTIKSLCEAAARQLHNTPTICRNSYIHPAVIDLSELDTEARQKRLGEFINEQVTGLRKSEAQCLAYLNAQA